MRLPTVFLGHGSPMNALANNDWSRAWAALGERLPRPKAVLAVSAHWYVPYTAVTAMSAPRTIHDFGGFPRELYAVRYAAPGDRALAERVQELLAPLPVSLDESWGLDHGTWSVLCHVYPHADVPVVQLSIDETQPPAFHYALGLRLRPLRGWRRWIPYHLRAPNRWGCRPQKQRRRWPRYRTRSRLPAFPLFQKPCIA